MSAIVCCRCGRDPVPTPMRATEEDILNCLRAHPEGMTSAQVASHFGRRMDGVSGRLSRLHSYGKINRKMLPRKPGLNNGMYAIWSAL